MTLFFKWCNEKQKAYYEKNHRIKYASYLGLGRPPILNGNVTALLGVTLQ